jgi:SAM-dependent methyltransferase
MSWLLRYQRNWDDLGEMDPFWAVLTTPKGKCGRWDVDEFFRTGAHDVGRVLAALRRLGFPEEYRASLDFGCAVGRLTRALAKHFDESWGVDISARMVERARALNAEWTGCRFVVNAATDLRLFPDRHFDLVLSMIVLQHIPRRPVIRGYIAEFVRVLKPGGVAVFQLPSYITLRGRIQRSARLYAGLRMLGFPRRMLYERLKLTPIRMNFLPEAEVRETLRAAGGHVLQVESEEDPSGSLSHRTYYVTRETRPVAVARQAGVVS